MRRQPYRASGSRKGYLSAAMINYPTYSSGSAGTLGYSSKAHTPAPRPATPPKAQPPRGTNQA